jgi:hypothetical protein
VSLQPHADIPTSNAHVSRLAYTNAHLRIRDVAVNAAMEGIPRPSCNNDSSGITQGEGLF